MRRTTVILLTATGLALAGCSSEPTKPTVAKASETQPASSPADPTPTPSKKAPELKVGDTAEINMDGRISAAALTYTDKGITGVPELLSDGQKWAALEVKVCNQDDEPIHLSPYPWSLAYTDGARIEVAGMNAGELPQPLYPMDAKVKGGDCVRGNIAFMVPKSGRPERVLYGPEGLEEPVEWKVSG